MPLMHVTKKDAEEAAQYKMGPHSDSTPLGEMDRDELMFWCKHWHTLFCQSNRQEGASLHLSMQKQSILESLRDLLAAAAAHGSNLAHIEHGLAVLSKASGQIALGSPITADNK